MEEGKKKPVMISVVVICLVVAVAVTIMTRPETKQGIKSIDADKTTWVKCRNETCQAEYEMGLREYYYAMEDAQKEDPSMLMEAVLTCKQCSEPSVFQAAKCAKCGLVFEVGWKRGDFQDRCPKPDCGYSQIEQDRKAAAGGGG
jgi:hypothetical protein